MITKTCKQCKTEYPKTVEHFHRNGKYLKSYCKKCAATYHKGRYLSDIKNNPSEQQRRKKYYQDNKDQFAERRKRWLENNREKVNEYQRQRRVDNPEWYTNYNRKYYADPHKRLRKAISRGMWGCLVGREKQSRSFEYIGCTSDELWIHLESLFQEGMTRENYGDWHVDHIRPLSSWDFNSDTESKLQEAWHYTNLQPLWAKDNLSKGSTYLKENQHGRL